MDELAAARIRVFLNDPSARGDASPAPSEPPRDTERSPWGFRVEGPSPPPRDYEPDTAEFLHWQLVAALDRGRRLWSARYPSSGTWVAGPVLPAVPVAGEDLNAFYDRRALHFFRGKNPETGTLVHSGESPDIAAHEQGHAVLDAVRPDLWDAPHFEVAAFHEAFGDLASIGIAFEETALVRAVLEETGGALDESNLVSRVAEELGTAARARFGPGVALPGALRDAVNVFTYVDPARLPASADADELSAEPHSFCRVFTGACWDILVARYLAAGGGRGNAAQDGAALSSSARQLGRIVAAATERVPVGAAFFSLLAATMAQEAEGDRETRDSLVGVFERRGFPRADLPARERTDEGIVEAGVSLPRETLGEIETLLGTLRPQDVLTRAPAGGGAVRGRRKRDLLLSGRQYGPADGACVELSDSFELSRRRGGLVTAAAVHPAGIAEEEDARAWVRFLARTDRIAPEGATATALELFRLKVSHRVVREEDGVRRLRRAWVD